MGLFGKSGEKIVTDREYSWKQNTIRIDGDYLLSSGVTTTVRVPVASIETVTWSMNPLKPTIAPNLKIIGCGTTLAEMAIGVDIINDVQDWFMKNVIKGENR